MNYRIEQDTMGEVKVPGNAYWGAQTQRSLLNFNIGGPAMKMPLEIIYSFAILKKAAAQTNCDLKVLSLEKSKIISRVCDEILAGELDEQFPLKVWQTGSGTQSNMNVNEVISNRSQIILKGKLTDKKKHIHPNDDVNKSQSSNDTFPTAMHIAVYQQLEGKLFPALTSFIDTMKSKVKEFEKIVKIGRTHFMDATPLTLGNEFSAYLAQMQFAEKAIKNSLAHLSEIALGGSAVGTGLNTPQGYSVLVAEKIAALTGLPFKTAGNKFEALSAHDALVETSGGIRQLAVSLMKIGNDIRMLTSGPRCGIGEINIPANEPGSSIMPGKVNPTQTEALTMVCVQVLGYDNSLAIGGMNGHFQLNVFKPQMAYNLLTSINLLADAMLSFNEHCLKGITANETNIKNNLNNSLMLVTSLNTHIGYEKAAEIAKKAFKENISLKEAALRLKYLTEEQFNEWVDPSKMLSPTAKES